MKSFLRHISFLFILTSFVYGDCTTISNFKYEVTPLYEKSGYKVFSLSNGSLVYTINSELYQSSNLTCESVSGKYWVFASSSIAIVGGAATRYELSPHYPYNYIPKPANTYSFSKYYTYNCSIDEVLNLKTNECQTCPKDHFLNQETGKCEKEEERPDWCPKPMLYNERKVEGFFGDKTIEECVPDPSISENDCKNRNMHYHAGCFDNLDSAQMASCMKFPVGCYAPQTVDRFKAEAQLNNDLFVLGGFMFPLPVDAIKNGWNSLAGFVKGLFGNNPKPVVPNLLEYRPQLVDMRATNNGPEPVFNFNPVNNEAIVTNNAFKQTGKFDSTPSSTNVQKTPQKLADVSPDLRKFDLPKDASVSSLQNNTIVSAKLKDMAKPMPTKEATVPNEVKNLNLDYDLNTMFKNSNKPTSNLPITIQQTGKVGNKTTYNGKITTPDNSIIDVEVIETTTSTGSKIQDVTLSHNYKTPSGNKKASTGYVNTIDSSGKVTNSIPKDSTITDPSTGSTTTNNGGSSSTNSTPTQSPDLSSLERAINQNNSKLDAINNTLSQTKSQLERANDTLTAIKNQQQAQWNYNPNIDTTTSFASLQNELTKFDVSIKDGFNFLNNLKGDIENLMNDFNNSLDIFNNGIDSPNIPKGTCPFTISGPTPGSNKTNSFVIDPCRFVSPYRPILTIFFTIWFSFEIIMFSLKYLFKVGGDS